jgi:hypothetical protein
LRNQVDAAHGVITLPMWRLKIASGAGRLGSKVRDSISGELLRRQLLHFPDPLPDSQDANVRIYSQHSLIGKLIKACSNLDAESDEQLRSFASDENAKLLFQIRSLLGS